MIEATSLQSLVARVNAQLAQGLELVGGPMAVLHGSSPIFAQAMLQPSEK